MKLIRTEDAVGHVLCHDMTQIIKDKYKDARFRKGHVVTEEDIPVLLSMGKEHLYVWEMTSGMVHENDAAERLLTLCGQENMLRSEVKEGKIELKAACDGVFLVDSQRLIAVNSQDEVMIATRRGGTAVRAGDKLAGMRVIPLIIAGEKLQKAERAAGGEPLLSLKPYVRKTACIVATGGEVKKRLIQDTFTPVVIDKLRTYGIETLEVVYSGDGVENVRDAVLAMRHIPMPPPGPYAPKAHPVRDVHRFPYNVRTPLSVPRYCCRDENKPQGRSILQDIAGLAPDNRHEGHDGKLYFRYHILLCLR